MSKRLYRDEFHQKIGGVCAGLAEYFETDVTIIRVLFVILLFVSVGFIAYIVLWIVLPKKGYLYNNFNNPTVDYRVPPQPADPSDIPPQPGRPFENYYQPNPFAQQPFDAGQNVPPAQKSHAGIIVGVVLIVLGAIILIHNYDLIPDIDFENVWPVILVVVGAGLIVSGQVSQPWHKADWSKDEKTADSSSVNPPASDNNSTLES